MSDVKQIGQYPQRTTPGPGDAILLQVGGAGGAYNWITPDDLVSGALLNVSKYLRLSPSSGIAFNGASLTYSAGTFVFSEAMRAKAATIEGLLTAKDIIVDGERVATQVFVGDAIAAVIKSGSASVEAQRAAISTYANEFNVALSALGGELRTFQGTVQEYVTKSLSGLQDWVAQQVAVETTAVTSWNGRVGPVELLLHDILFAGGAPIQSPHFTGYPRAPTPWDVRQKDDVIATTAFVHNSVCTFLSDLLTNQPFVFMFNGRQGNVVLRTKDVTDAYFTTDGDVPQAPNPAPYDSSNRIPTTAWVGDSIATAINVVLETIDFDLQKLLDYIASIYAPINSPAFVGVPSGPTAASGTNTDQLATTAFVMAAVAASTTGVATWNGRTGNVVLTAQDIIDAGGAPLDSPVFIGDPHAPTPAPGDNDTSVATTAFVTSAVSSAIAALPPHVASFNGRTGAVTLTLNDVTLSGALHNTILTGQPIAPTPLPSTNSDRLATTAFVHQVTSAIMAASVRSWNGRTGTVTMDLHDITSVGGAPIDSPTFTGIPRAPTAAPGNNSSQIATTAFVNTALLPYALLDSPTFIGFPTAPTPLPGDNDTSIATTAFVTSAITAFSQDIVLSFNGRIGAVTLNLSDITGAGGAPIQDPIFLGDPQAPTPAPGDSDTSIATTAFVANVADGLQPSLILGDTPPATANEGDIFYSNLTGDMFVWHGGQWNLVGGGAGTAGVSSFNTRTGDVALTLADITAAGGAPINGPIFVGTPQGPTAAVGNNTQQLATTAYVLAAMAAATAGVASWNGRTGVVAMTAADITAAGGALLLDPIFTGDPQAPTPAPGDNDASIATTAFVTTAVNNGIATNSVTSWNGRQGAVTLQPADITAVGGAFLASPIFTGDPRAPTPLIGDSDTTIATTAFVHSVVAQATTGLVSSFNTRTGNVTLTLTDVTNVGGAPLTSPVFSGDPRAPTQVVTDNDTSIATTAFVHSVVNSVSAGVTTFNTRAGDVLLTTADVTAAGGAPISSPIFIGDPRAPTPADADNDTSIATTAWARRNFISFDPASPPPGGINLSLYALINSPIFTGNPQAPTPLLTDSDTSLATTAFVSGNLANYLSISNASAQYLTIANAMTLYQPLGNYLRRDATDTISVGYTVASANLGTLASQTLNPALGNYQYGTNNVAFTLTAPANDCAIDLMVTNGTTPGAITFSGFTVGANTGDTLTVVTGNKFVISARRIGGISTYTIKALQ